MSLMCVCEGQVCPRCRSQNMTSMSHISQRELFVRYISNYVMYSSAFRRIHCTDSLRLTSLLHIFTDKGDLLLSAQLL